ncbi:uncharacterized protein EDB91DRAFT_1161586 [Suillus paluster]|uniref:uncharacterized protein n=1 Tax=Suillus paluster TaxID=48578 RepID=UPI001B871FB6|nr:uncharacterized protein EDB91DRAFT_1161586 [Suillus paluster]KAG1728502.1 hypothetical protein EDB91DRAFT_1161586 [Suillus paluster]
MSILTFNCKGAGYSQLEFLGVTYGTPRIRNAVWAALFDSLISDFQRVNNKDVIPIIPGRLIGFSHVQGEVHIIPAV